MRTIRVLCIGAALTGFACGSSVDEEGGAGAGGGGTGASSGAGGSSGFGGQGGSAGSSGSGGSGGAACDFTATTTCQVPVDLGSIPGDSGSTVKTAEGKSSQWLKFYLSETDSSIGDITLTATATLVSPPGMSYVLEQWSCGSAQPIQSGANGVIKISWSDTWGDDGGSVQLYVRHVSGSACGPSDRWTLQVKGNT